MGQKKEFNGDLRQFLTKGTSATGIREEEEKKKIMTLCDEPGRKVGKTNLKGERGGLTAIDDIGDQGGYTFDGDGPLGLSRSIETPSKEKDSKSRRIGIGHRRRARK